MDWENARWVKLYCQDTGTWLRIGWQGRTVGGRDLASAEELNYRTDSDRYAELRKLVEAWQSHTVGSSQALADWSHR